jgi:hypothetical protein
MNEIERNGAIRYLRSRRIKSCLVAGINVVALGVACHDHGAAGVGLYAASAVAGAAVRLWVDVRRLRFHLDGDGQPISGRDADRFARYLMREYQQRTPRLGP